MNSRPAERVPTDATLLDLADDPEVVHSANKTCWQVARCSAEQRESCTAWLARRSCWELWEAIPAEESGKGCCHPLVDCSHCVITAGLWTERLPPFLAIYRRSRAHHRAPANQVCEHLYVTTSCGQPVARLPQAGQALDDQQNVFRCRLRTGTHLLGGFVADVCLTKHNLDCVFRPADQ